MVLAPVIMLVDASPIIQAVVANLIGGIIFRGWTKSGNQT